MDPKKRAILVAAIAITIVVGILASFGFPVFSRTPSIQLPSGNGTQSSEGEDSLDLENSDWIRVTTQTVQSAIETLERSDSYYRDVSVELFWDPDDETRGSYSTISVWADNGYVKTWDRTTQKQRLLAGGRLFVWYSGDRSFYEKEAEAPDINVLGIPTYEKILDIDQDLITNANFERKGEEEEPCIYVEVEYEVMGYYELYWVSTRTGLLYAAETVRKEDGSLIYRMSQTAFSAYTGSGSEFRLPDGTNLEELIGVGIGAEAEE